MIVQTLNILCDSLVVIVLDGQPRWVKITDLISRNLFRYTCASFINVNSAVLNVGVKIKGRGGNGHPPSSYLPVVSIPVLSVIVLHILFVVCFLLFL